LPDADASAAGGDGGGARPGNDGPASSLDLAQAGNDMALPPPADLALSRGGDMNEPVMGRVGPSGGTVNLLHFGLTGDTRPPSCEDTVNYPTAVINGIAAQLKSRSAQFVVDLGDHMYVCNDDLNVATAQMGLYMNAVQLFGGTWFMTEGNHECWKGPCLAGSQNANYVAFMAALAPVSRSPYYSFGVQTSLGIATFVIIADNSWDNGQASWLDSTLAAADQGAKYTIVARHHPESDTSVITNPDIMVIIRRHKFALFISGHDHLYKHPTTDGGRDLVLGNAGAPLIVGGTFYGFAMVDQLQTGQLQVSVYDLNNANAPLDTWAVGPNR
jgi:hypothetical protein